MLAHGGFFAFKRDAGILQGRFQSNADPATGGVLTVSDHDSHASLIFSGQAYTTANFFLTTSGNNSTLHHI